jgi:hypothetical protein
MLCEDLTSKFAAVVIPADGDLLDIELNDDVIVKAYDDHMILDLGSKKSSLERDEFASFNFI